MDTNFSNLLTPQQCGEILGGAGDPISISTLAHWRSNNSYPELPWLKIGGAIRYRREDVEAFLRSRLRGGGGGGANE